MENLALYLFASSLIFTFLLHLLQTLFLFFNTTTGELDASRNNLEIAKQILALRVQQAQMHGYENYAQYALADTMAGKPAKVMELLEVSEICFFWFALCAVFYLSFRGGIFALSSCF